jgi:hypothetical protein
LTSIYKNRNFKPVDSDSDSEINSITDNIKVQLEWIDGIKKQIDFLNNPETLPDFQIYFKVELRRPPL